MNKDIALYIGGQKIDWTKTPDILLTYERTDYQNPTITKNMWSKTISIQGTPNNNNIFNHIWNLERCIDENFNLFNPSQRVSFELFNDAELVEKGYAKLQSIQRNGNKIEYSIQLYGSIGSFFYSLAYDVDTDKEKTLADLNFLGGSNPDDEFNFEINKNTVKNAWDALNNYGHNSGSKRMFDYINFIPCYNGIDGFDADRVLINTHGLNGTKVRYTDGNSIVNDNFPMHITDGEHTYYTMNGYLTGQMMRECNEYEMMDLRSYLQRPGLSIKGFFNAICDPQNNGGFNVVLDQEFFSSGNPYFSKAFMTLQILSTDNDASDQYEDWDWYIADKYIRNGNRGNHVLKIASINPIVGTPDAFQMDIEVHATITGLTADKLYTSALNNNGYEEGYEYDPEDPYSQPNPPQLYYYGCTLLQMYGFGNSSLWYNAPAKCGSNVICLTSKMNGQYIGTQSINTWYDKQYNESDIQYNFGYWKRVSGSDYVWHNETDDTDLIHLTMDSNLMSQIPSIAIDVANVMIMNGALVETKCATAYDAQYYDFQSTMNEHSRRYKDTLTIENLDSDIVFKVSGKMRSYKPVTKKDLLGGLDGTPTDWLLSYCKLFGLFFEYDKHTDTIYIKMRKNFYKDEVVDLEDKIDRSNAINITPLTFESKWYNFQYAEAEGKLLDKYQNTYSQPFGKQLIDTKYNFDADEIDLLENCKFKNGLTALEKSNYYNVKYDINGNRIPQCLFNWCTVTYYRNTNETLDTNMCLPQTHTLSELNPNTPKEFYDVIPKLQIKGDDGGSVDGEGILVFFNGLKGIGNADYWITDDVDEMFIESENPCWLQTQHEWNANWTERIAIHTSTIPEFSRYVINRNIIVADLNFGYTKELFVPYYSYDINRTCTLYQNFWRSYIQDLYNVDTRNVTCNVVINSNDINEFMKKFYWWDNSLWVCTQVKDFDIALDKSTLCSFTKVNNKNSYLETPTFVDDFFNFTLLTTHNIPAQGTDDELSFYFNLDCSSNWTVIDDGSGFASFDPDYPTEGGFGMGYVIKAKYLPNYSQSPRYALYSAYNEYGDARMIRVWQDGYVKEKYLNVQPNTVLLPKTVTDAVNVEVDSSEDWWCNGLANWVSINPLTGNGGTTTIQVSAQTNTNGSERTNTVTFHNNDGINTTLTIKQKGEANVSLEQNEILPVYTVPASGGNVFYKLISEVETEIRPIGNTANYAVASGLVTYNTTIQPTSGTNFWIHFDPNTSTVTRNASFYAYYEEDGGRYAIFPTRVQLPLQQLASGNTEVTYQSKSYTSATTLGASMRWTATTENDWITLITTSGTSANTSVDYTLSQNNGGYRTGYIYVTYTDEMGYYANETIVIHQEGVDIPWSVSPTAITVDNKGGDYIIGVTAQTQFSVSMSEDWCRSELTKDGMFTIHIEENEGYARTMNVVVSADGSTKNVVINQGSKYPDDYTLDYVPQELIFNASGGVITVTIRSDSDWEIISNE